jgi:peroxiredoxin
VSSDAERGIGTGLTRPMDELTSAFIPALHLDSTAGPVNLADLAAGRLVLFIYPHATGLPDAPVPGWELIPGAVGCTAESCAFQDRHDRLSELGASLAGMSVQTVAEQREFASRVGLRYRLISDPRHQLAEALDLPRFTAGGRTFYRRLTIIVRRGRIEKTFYPITRPADHAEHVIRWLSES